MTAPHLSRHPDEAPPRLPADLELGAVELTVTDLDESVAFYERAIGLQVRSRDAARATLGTATDDLLVLVGDPTAPRASRAAGLYHVALRFPSRDELAQALRRLAESRTPISGASDHGVSEAIYLSDPDGNGLELYADRPRSAWPAPQGPGERVGMYTIALDVHALLDLAAGAPAAAHAAPGLRVGHLHLHVGDVQRAVAFYADVLGFEVMVDLPTASFLAAGGYHHHLAVNVWRGVDVPAPPPGAVGLRQWSIVLPSAHDVAQARFRAVAAGVRIDERDGGFVARDPWDAAVHVRAAH